MASHPLSAVGFIGLGDQGLPMAVAIAEAGYALQAWDRRTVALDGLKDVLHTPHATLVDLAAASEIVCMCVSTDEDVMQTLAGGLLDNLRPGAIVVNHGTGTPRQARLAADACAAAGVEFLDAPVSGARVGAEARTLSTMVGGPKEVALKCEPIFQSFSSHVTWLGGHGAGQMAKLINNTLMAMNLANITEIIGLIGRLKLDPVAFVQVLRNGSGSSSPLKELPTKNPALFAKTIGHTQHMLDVLLLDMELFDTAMKESGVQADEITARGVIGATKTVDMLRTLNS